MTYSGGLSRAYVRSWAPAERYGFSCFSPFTDRRAMTAAVTIPFNTILDGSLERLYSLKGELVASGVRQVTGADMPIQPKRRFQDGIAQAAATSAALGGDTENNAVYKGWRVGKAWCRRTFLRQWEDRLRTAWEEAEHVSGNHVPGLPEPLLQ
jgi:asparagine synthase (glutamine-hydrolysing)